LKVVAFLHIEAMAFDLVIVEDIEKTHGRIDTLLAAEELERQGASLISSSVPFSSSRQVILKVSISLSKEAIKRVGGRKSP
jgi:hypothetical protein